MVDEQVSAEGLERPLSIVQTVDERAADRLNNVASSVVDAISNAKRPVVFVDALMSRHGAVGDLRTLVNQLKLPVFHSGIGVGIIDTCSDLVVGCYNGALSNPGINEYWDASDLRLVFGRLPADTNTAGFSQDMPSAKTIDFKPTKLDVR